MTKKYRLAILAAFPVQYQAPLFCKIAKHPAIDLTVYYCADYFANEARDPSFGSFKWDIPLLEGYKYKFLKNLSPNPGAGFFGHINPQIIREITRNSYDAILIYGYVKSTNWFAFLGAWLSKTPILILGESHLLNYRAKWKEGLKRGVLSQLFKRISSFLYIGTLSRAYYKHYGVPDRKLFSAPYAVDNDFFLSKHQELQGERNQLKKDIGVAPELPVILYASKMMQRKRAMDLLKAFGKTQKRVDVSLVFVGDGVERPTLEAYSKDHDIRNVHFVGFKNQTELPDYFVIADVFVLPSTDEPWGLIINEAMNFGLPIITTDQVGAGYDLVKDGKNGFVYPVGDIEKLANCLLRLFQNPELKERMGKYSSEIISRWSYNEGEEGILNALEYIKKQKF